VPIYELTNTFPEIEKFDLCKQMQRACKSVVDNIVEGYSHIETPLKAKAFWRLSMGSANEMVEHLEQSASLKYAALETPQPFIDEYTIIAKQLNKLIQNWRKR
jgi:four helix bundle protein